MNILVTGTSGFIGFFLAKKLLELGYSVIGVDCENDYYDVNLKLDRRKILQKNNYFKFYKIKLENYNDLEKVFIENKIDKVCNLAAQAGVRYSIDNPFVYIESNIIGFHNIINLAAKYKVANFVYASSSSVYGKNEKQPFSVEDKVDNPVSLYAVTKKTNELIAHTYSHLYDLPTTGLRFFTVYGPYSRPDMAMLKFALKMQKGDKIEVYNNGDMLRDFTYIDDIIDGIILSLNQINNYEIFNLGNDKPVKLEYMIDSLEKHLGYKTNKVYLPMQDGDLKSTWSDIDHTYEKLGWRPKIDLDQGIEKFCIWFKEYYK
ncbi:MAG: GDP-mannose 4,6-dehydratase [Candidatus Gracilibacteria bacterium]|nr:GDP-mannose 4,6-dehydratase [Candidatus Gracilibacteria bacterium]